MRWRTTSAAAATLASLALLLASCSSMVPDSGPVAVPPPPTVPTTVPTTAPTTSAPPVPVPPTTATTTPHVVAAGGATPFGAVPPQGLGVGDRGPQVAALERALDGLRYDVGAVDDGFDESTRHGVVAFQKVAGLPRTGRATQDVVDRLATAQPPSPMVPGGGATRVEIDLARQVLLLYEGDALQRVLPISSGSGRRFCDEGRCRKAVTPSGRFAVYKRVSGWRKSDLGRLYNPLYFNEGIAIHGYPSVPATPASHGCVRIPMAAAEWLPARVPDGTAVYVLDGARRV